jgi:hypothetical protein
MACGAWSWCAAYPHDMLLDSRPAASSRPRQNTHSVPWACCVFTPYCVITPRQGHGVKLLGRLPCVQKVQVSIAARRMVPFFGAMALSLSVLLSGLCPCGASVRGSGFGHFASTKCHPV